MWLGAKRKRVAAKRKRVAVCQLTADASGCLAAVQKIRTTAVRFRPLTSLTI